MSGSGPPRLFRTSKHSEHRMTCGGRDRRGPLCDRLLPSGLKSFSPSGPPRLWVRPLYSPRLDAVLGIVRCMGEGHCRGPLSGPRDRVKPSSADVKRDCVYPHPSRSPTSDGPEGVGVGTIKEGLMDTLRPPTPPTPRTPDTSKQVK